MRRGSRRRAAAAALLLGLSGWLPAAALEVPMLSGRVNDLADIVPPDTEARIEAALAALEEETGAQVAVLTVASLEGDSLEDFTLRVAETWRLGRGEFDDGALLFVARDDRKMRLEVGYGLEGAIPDALAGRILDDVLRPRFRAGDFGGGLEAGVEAIGGLIRGDATLPPPSAQGESPGLGARLAMAFIFFPVVGLFSLIALGSRGCQGWFMYAFLLPFWSAFPLGIFGFPVGALFGPAWLILYPLAKLLLGKTERGRRFAKSGPFGPLLDGSMVRSSGGSSFGGGFSSGGFSGGGGSFGGGGASSSW